MAYHEYLLNTPYAYIAVAGLIAGVGIGGLIPGRHVRFSDERTRYRRLVRLYLCLTATLLLGLAGLFVPGPEQILDRGLLPTAGVGVAVGALVARFPRAAGMPVVVLAVAAAAAIALLHVPWAPVSPPEAVVDLRVLRAGGGTVTVEYAPRDGGAAGIPAGFPGDGAETVVSASGSRLSMTVEVLQLSRGYFLAGMAYGYRLVELNGAPLVERRDVFDRPQGASRWLYDLLARHERALPGIRLSRVESNEVEPRPLDRYVLTLAPGAPQTAHGSAPNSAPAGPQNGAATGAQSLAALQVKLEWHKSLDPSLRDDDT
jgi:hypothetical protein